MERKEDRFQSKYLQIMWSTIQIYDHRVTFPLIYKKKNIFNLYQPIPSYNFF